MSRPTYTATKTRVDINVPAGWYSTVVAISRKPYNQLVRINHGIGTQAQARNYYMESIFGKSNETMQDSFTRVKAFTFIAAPTPQRVLAEFFHAKDEALSGIDIAEEQYRSNKFQVVTFSKPTGVAKAIPDYENFIIHHRLEAAFSRGAGRSSIKRVLLFRSNFRPPPHEFDEHFGYKDGISQTQIKDVTYSDTTPMRFPGSPTSDMGVIVMGYEGDEDISKRPAWTKDGSFMVFRKLKTFVPEFRRFLIDESVKVFPNLPPEQASNLFGARLFGRWKSGTPIVLSPDVDKPEIAADPKQVNNFDYSKWKDQSICPFASHTRKSNPRENTAKEKRHMIRRQSIAYGPELMDDELQQGETLEDRGLILICYQSSIVRGFKYIQQNSYNNPNYPPGDSPPPGYDAIVGQTGLEQSAQPTHRFISGMNPKAQANHTIFPIQFIESNGGEYFFVPSMSTLRDIAANRKF